jgi:hypothetical protein
MSRHVMTSLFGLGAENKWEDRILLETEEVNRYALNNPKQYFSRLMENDLYARDVEELLKETKGRAYFVTGFLKTKGALWTFSNSKTHRHEASATFPISTIGAGPVAILAPELDPQVSGSFARSRERVRRMIVEEEEIFAVAYSIIKRSTSLGMHSSRVRHQSPYAGHHGWKHSTMGSVRQATAMRAKVKISTTL